MRSLGTLTIPVLASVPSGGQAGQVVMVNGRLYRYYGNAWGEVAPTGTTGMPFAVKETEIEFLMPVMDQKFTVVDTSVSVASRIVVTQSGIAATGRAEDENEFDPILFAASPGNGVFTLYAHALSGPVRGRYRVNYVVG